MNYRRSVLSVLVVALLAAGGCTRQVSFSQNVKPILNAKCLSCHNGKGEGSARSGFSVVNYENVIAGTKFGKVVVPGSALSSSLYLMVAQKTSPEIQMPPHHTESVAKHKLEPLTEAELDVVKRWIDQGAKNN